MARNMVFKDADNLTVTLTAQAWPVATAGALSGGQVVVGAITGVALAASDATTKEVVIRRKGVFTLTVGAFDNETNDNASAVAAGDALYIRPSTGVINKWTGGVLFGHALEAIASASAAIKVLLR